MANNESKGAGDLGKPRPQVPSSVPAGKLAATGSHQGDTAGASGSGPMELPARFGRYRVKKKLGGGGMGSVYLVENTELEREEALKVPHFAEGDDPQVRERFLREAKSAAKLDHANLCPVYDVGVQDGIYYLTMRFLKGTLLSDYAGKAQPARKAVEIVTKLSQALEAAHAKGVIHRDLKPSNVMMVAGVGPVVMDFGLAKQVKQLDQKLTQAGAMLGTPAYMPPEQVNGDLERMGPASDVYSLGVILYELLTGQLPFKGTTASIFGQILFTEPPLPSAAVPGLNPALDGICRKAMAKTPTDRYPSMKAFTAVLMEYLRSTPVTEGAGRMAPTTVNQAAIFQARTVAPGPAPTGKADAFQATEQAAVGLPGRTRSGALKWVLAGASVLIVLSACILLTVVGIAWMWNKKEDAKGEHAIAKDKSEGKEGSKNLLQPPPPKGPVLEDGPDGLLKGMTSTPYGATTLTVLFAPDGLRAAARWAGNAPFGNGRAYGLDLFNFVKRPMEPWGSIYVPKCVANLVFSPDGRRLAEEGGETIVLYDGKSYQKDNPPISLPGSCTALAFTPDSKVLATAERAAGAGAKHCIRFWDAAERDVAKKPINVDDPVVSLSFSPDGRFLATSHAFLTDMNLVNLGDKKINIFRYEDGQLMHQLNGHPNSVSVSAYFADGKRLFSASPYDGTLRVWNVDLEDKENVGKEVKKPIQAGKSATGVTKIYEARDPEYLTAIAFWPWGRALTAQQDGGLVFWDLDTGARKRYKSPAATTACATALAISPDGHHALAAYSDDRMYLFRLPPPAIGKDP